MSSRERSAQWRRVIEKMFGVCRRENVGMSSEKYVRTVFAVNLRFLTEG